MNEDHHETPVFLFESDVYTPWHDPWDERYMCLHWSHENQPHVGQFHGSYSYGGHEPQGKTLLIHQEFLPKMESWTGRKAITLGAGV